MAAFPVLAITVASLLVSVAQVAVSLLRSGPKAPKTPTLSDLGALPGGRVSMRIQPKVPQQLVVGMARVGLRPVHGHIGGIKDRDLWLISPLVRTNGQPIAGFGPVYLNDVAIRQDWIKADGPFKGQVTKGPFKGQVYIFQHLGGPNQVAEPALINGIPTLDNAVEGWSATDRLEECAYIAILIRVGIHNFPTQGIPDVTVDVRGNKFLDSRSGQTIWTDNAVVAASGWLTTPEFGPGSGAGQIDSDLAEAQANICDEMVNLPKPSASATVSGNEITVAFTDLTVAVGDFIAGDHDSGPGSDFDGFVSDVIDFGEGSGSVVFTIADTIEAAENGDVKTIPDGSATVTRSLTFDVTIGEVDGKPNRITGPGRHLRVTIGQYLEETNGAAFFGYVSNIIVNGFGDPDDLVVFEVATSLATARDGAAATLPSGPARITMLKEPRYTANGSITSEQVRGEVKRQFERAMEGSIIDTGRTWAIRCGAYAAPTVEIQLQDSAGPLKVATEVPRAQRFNRVRGRYAGAATNGQRQSYPPFTDAAMLAEDRGEKRWGEIDRELTNSPTMATRLGRIAARKTRKPITVEGPFHFNTWRLQAGEFAFLTNPRWAFSMMPVWIATHSHYTVGQAPQLALRVDMTMRQSGPDVFEDTADELPPKPPPRVNPFDDVPEDVVVFSVTQSDKDTVQFAWREVEDANELLEGYTIARGPAGSTPLNGAIVTVATKGTAFTTKFVPPLLDDDGTPLEQSFWIWARNKNQKLSATPKEARETVKPLTFDIVVRLKQNPSWIGTLSGWVVGVTGALIPDSTKQANQHSIAELFESFVPFPVASGSFETTVYDTGFDAENIRVYADLFSHLGPGVTDGDSIIELEVDTRLDAESFPGFVNWSIGTRDLRHIKARISKDFSTGLAAVDSFLLNLDVEEFTQGEQGLAVPSTGLSVTYPRRYFKTPALTVHQPDSNLVLDVTNESATGFDVTLKDRADTAAAGVVNWSAYGG